MQAHEKGKYPKEKFYKNVESNKMIHEAIWDLSWNKLERLNGSIITHLDTILESNYYKNEKKQDIIDLAESFILKMSNSRSLHGNDLTRLFKLIKQL